MGWMSSIVNQDVEIYWDIISNVVRVIVAVAVVGESISHIVPVKWLPVFILSPDRRSEIARWSTWALILAAALEIPINLAKDTISEQAIATLSEDLRKATKMAEDAGKKAAEGYSLHQQRRLSEAQKTKLIDSLSPFAGQKVIITSVMGDGEGDIFKSDFVVVLEAAAWDHDGDAGIKQSVIMPTPTGIQVTMNQSEAEAGHVLKSVETFVQALRELGLTDDDTIFINPQVPAGSVKLIIGNRPRPQ